MSETPAQRRAFFTALHGGTRSRWGPSIKNDGTGTALPATLRPQSKFVLTLSLQPKHGTAYDTTAAGYTEGPAGKSKAYVNLSRGWALGAAEYKQALIKDHDLLAESRAWERSGAREIRETCWTARLAECLRKLGKTEADAKMDRKGATWKAAVAHELKQTTQASNRWLAERLHMGRPEAVSVHVGRFRAGQKISMKSQVFKPDPCHEVPPSEKR